MNSPIDQIDFNGKSYLDYVKKIHNEQIPKCIGMAAGGLAGWKPQPWEGTIAGAQTGVYFFPDSCEIAFFSITTSAVTTDWNPPTKEELNGKWYELSLIASIGIAGELAYYMGSDNEPGHANAESFEGPFHTLEGAHPVVSASLYYGDELNGGWWEGGTIGLGAGAGVAIVDWYYEIIGDPIKLDDDESGIFGRCFCNQLIKVMP